MWRDVEVVVVVNVVRGLFARGDVDPLGGGLGARYADGGAIVIEVRASTLLIVCLGGWFKDANACEIVCCLAMR